MWTRESLRQDILNDDARGLEFRREMANGVLSQVDPLPEVAEFHRASLAIMDELAAKGLNGRVDTRPSGDQAEHRRSGGQTAKNQFGTFEVKYATDRQAGFLANLLETRDYSGHNDRTRAEIEKAARELGTGKVAKRLASDAIEALLECPQIPGTAHAVLASEAQVTTIRKVYDRKVGGVEALQAAFAESGVTEIQNLSRSAASAVLDVVMNAPWKPRTTESKADLEEGVYVLDGDYYRVIWNQEKTRQYATVWNADTEAWDFAKGVIYRITAAMKITKEQAAEFGALWGRCVRCGRRITASESLERSMGRTCYGRLFG